jgi:hypothetical protein
MSLKTFRWIGGKTRSISGAHRLMNGDAVGGLPARFQNGSV